VANQQQNQKPLGVAELSRKKAFEIIEPFSWILHFPMALSGLIDHWPFQNFFVCTQLHT
jgi:hypothetical protein